MYLPRAFDTSDPASCHALIRQESFGLLVTTDDDGVPFATHLPFLLHADASPLGTLAGHVARPNPQWRHLQAGRTALAVFSGSHAYVSPSWYSAHPSVPTWNYLAVHAYGRARLVEEPAAVKALLAELVGTYEGGRAESWRMESLPADYLDRMIGGIVAFEIPVERLEGKAKLSQNRDATDRAGTIAGLRAAGDPWSAAVADLMAAREAGAGRSGA